MLSKQRYSNRLDTILDALVACFDACGCVTAGAEPDRITGKTISTGGAFDVLILEDNEA